MRWTDTLGGAGSPHEYQHPVPLGRAGPLTEHVEELWEAVAAMDEHTATGLVLRMLDEGVHAESVLLDVIAVVQGRVGEEWAATG